MAVSKVAKKTLLVGTGTLMLSPVAEAVLAVSLRSCTDPRDPGNDFFMVDPNGNHINMTENNPVHGLRFTEGVPRKLSPAEKLHKAVCDDSKGALDRVKALVKQGVDVNTFLNGDTPLLKVCSNACFEDPESELKQIAAFLVFEGGHFPEKMREESWKLFSNRLLKVCGDKEVCGDKVYTNFLKNDKHLDACRESQWVKDAEDMHRFCAQRLGFYLSTEDPPLDPSLLVDDKVNSKKSKTRTSPRAQFRCAPECTTGCAAAFPCLGGLNLSRSSRSSRRRATGEARPTVTSP
jgi:hypothetical protein